MGRSPGWGVPLPLAPWDLFWGQRGKPRFKQEKLELALNSERVCWGLASRGLPRASRLVVGLCRLGSQGSRALYRLLTPGLPLPRAAMGEEKPDVGQQGQEGKALPPHPSSALPTQAGKSKTFRMYKNVRFLPKAMCPT